MALSKSSIVLTALAISLGFVGYSFYQRYVDSTFKKFPKGTYWDHPSLPFRVLNKDDWKFAAVGSFSDGSAEAEFYVDDYTYAVVFDQAFGDGTSSVMGWRRESMREQYSDVDCFESRTLEESSLKRVSELFCEGLNQEDGAPALLYSKHFDDGKNHLELLVRSVSYGDKELLKNKINRFIDTFEMDSNSYKARK